MLSPLKPSPSLARESLRCLACALVITVLNLGILLHWVMPSGGYKERYHRLVQHDSYWFLNILGRGYQSPIPPSPIKRMEVSNVAFFPGIILWAATITKVCGLDPKTGLTLASQLATWGFWTYFLLIARRQLHFSWKLSAVAVALVLAHPVAFYLIAAYSESLFLLLLLGFMFWSAREGPGAFVLAALHGVGMTGTRIAGAPAAAFPFVRAWFRRTMDREVALWRRMTSPSLLRAGVLMALSLAGMAAFFIYCHVRFQHWDFYMMTQEAGWGVRADYLGLFKAAAYQRWWPNWRVASQVGQFSVPITMIGLVALAGWEIAAARRGLTRWRERIGFYFVGFMLFYIAVSGVFSVRLESMTRYHFCTHVFLVLGAVHAFADIGPKPGPSRNVLIALIVLLALVGAGLHHTFAGQYVRGEWVA
jgi:hypothetical protein